MIDLLNLGAIKNADLKNYCTFKIGGNAKFLFEVKNKTHLLKVCKICKLHNIKYKVIGMGANLLFNSEGFDGAIIVAKFNKTNINKNIVVADTGTNLTAFITLLAKYNLSGIENLAGIPATIGGAIVNNVSSHGTCISDFVEYVECYKTTNLNKKLIIGNLNCNFGYRESIFSSGNYIITKVCFKFIKSNSQQIRSRIKQAIKQKIDTQPLNYPSAGSIFKRGEIIVSKTIDELGLKGLRSGDAQVSTKHAGFIVNLGKATSDDVLALISLIKEKVFISYGKILQTEVEIVK